MTQRAPLRFLCARLMLLPQWVREIRNAEHADPLEDADDFDRFVLKAAEEAAAQDERLMAAVARLKAAEQDYRTRIRKCWLELIDQTARLTQGLNKTLKGVVPHPADEQSKVRMFVARVRAAALGQGPLPTIEELVEHVGRLWTLADAIGEPITFTPEMASGDDDTSARKPGMTPEQRARALIAILDGTCSSTRKLAGLIGVTQSAVQRDEVLRAAFKTRRRGPRHHGHGLRGGGVDAVEGP